MASDEDYGDYVTRCVCGFMHDDGYMICCDGCSVWQHVECMKVDPKNLPDKYLCEKCDPRPVDKKRARGLQMKKRDELSDFDDEDGSNPSTDDGRRSPLPSSLQQLQAKRRRKQQQRSTGSTRVQELKVEARKTGRKDKSDKEKDEGKKAKRKIKISPHHSTSSGPYSPLLSGVQTLLSAASALEEQQQDVDLWSSTSSPWSDPYDACHQNSYSESVLAGPYNLLRSFGTVYSSDEFTTVEARVSQPMCMLKDVASLRKGVVAASRFAEQSIIMEYKGRVLIRQELSGGRFLWKHSPCPFVYQYNRLEVCIDSRSTGNLARFVRRSCKSNAELRHFFVNDKLHFGLYATSIIATGDEITLPFDFRYEKCEYLVECACAGGVGQCMLSRSPSGSSNKRKSSRTSSTDEDHPPRSIGRSPCLLSTQTLDEDSNSSWTSTGSHRKRTRQLPVRSSREQISDSDSDEHEDGEIKRAKSREERKTEAVWRMFEKMEASERRRHHLMSESSQDGEQSPFRSVKERRVSVSSTGSKKSHLLPASRLSSSTDLLSPEPMDAFSPPLTPSLTSSLTNIPVDTLPSPSHVAHRLGFEASPYLHPKYLLADFALPRKKAILHQWEAESREGERERDGGGGHNIVINGGPQWAQNGYSVVATARNDNNHTRSRGCLKHRWMDQHKREKIEGKESSLIDNSNIENGCSEAANHKKRLLHRWLEIHHEEGGRQDECEMETEVPKETVAQDEEPERPSSSLFEDFSDDDFDEREENGTSKEGVKMDTDSAVEREKLEEKEIDTVTVTPPTSPPIVATKPVSSQIQPSPVADNSPPTPPLQFSPAIESYTQETAPEKTDVKNDETEMDVSLPQPSTKILVVTETISPQPVNLSDSLLSSVSDDASSDKLQPEMLDSLSRPAGKRKMSLLEYRSRGKRPGAPEGKKTVLPPISIDRPSVSSPSSTSTTSLLSPSVSLLSFSSSFLSGSSRLASQPSTPHLPHPLTSTGSSPSHSTAETTGPSHFEPVSPDDVDLTNQGTEEAPILQSSSSQPPTSISSSSHKPVLLSPDPAASVIRTSTHGYVTPPLPAGRGGQFIMDSRWSTAAPTVDVQDPRRSIHHTVDVYPPLPPPPPSIPMEFPQYPPPVHTHRTAQQMQRGLLPHPSPGLLQPTTTIPPHPPPPGGYIVFRPPHHPHSTTYH